MEGVGRGVLKVETRHSTEGITEDLSIADNSAGTPTESSQIRI
jgi:hypothetical protein